LKSNWDNVTTGEQHTGRQRSDSAEPDSEGFSRNSSCIVLNKTLHKRKSFSVQQFFKNAAEVQGE